MMVLSREYDETLHDEFCRRLKKVPEDHTASETPEAQ
jgi:hypothetical protein